MPECKSVCSRAVAKVDLPDADKPVNQIVKPYRRRLGWRLETRQWCMCDLYLLAQKSLTFALGDSAFVPGNVGCHCFLTRKKVPNSENPSAVKIKYGNLHLIGRSSRHYGGKRCRCRNENVWMAADSQSVQWKVWKSLVMGAKSGGHQRWICKVVYVRVCKLKS